jgi:hypothetical protein
MRSTGPMPFSNGLGHAPMLASATPSAPSAAAWTKKRGMTEIDRKNRLRTC